MIYYRHVAGECIYLIYGYTKTVREDLTREQLKALVRLMKDISDG